MPHLRLLLCSALALLAPLAARADHPRIAAALNPSTIALGESTRLEVQIIGSEALERPPLVRVEGLEIQTLQTGRQQSVSIINGRIEQNVIVVYAWEVTAKRPGSFTIPALDFSAGGEVLHTQPIALKVEKPGAQLEGLDTQGHAEIVFPKKTAWVGELLPVRLRLLVDSRINWQFTALPSLETEGFTHGKTSQPRSEVIERDGRSWDDRWFQTTVTPLKAGRITLGPAEFAWVRQIPRAQRARPAIPFSDLFPESVMRGMGAPQRMTSKAEPAEILVKPLPLEGQPPSFSGAVGKFQITAEGAPARVKLGDPMTMKVTVRGQGDFDRVAAPVLADSKGWRTYPATIMTPAAAPDDERLTDSKTFEVAVIPEAKQSRAPVFELAYFDPDAAKYVTLRTASGPLVVEGEPAPATPAPGASRATPAPAPAATDIAGLHYQPGSPRSARPLYFERRFQMAQLAPLALLLGWMLSRLWRRRPAANPVTPWRRQRAALAAQLRRERQRQPFFETAAQLLQHDTALLTGQPPETVDAADARRALPESAPVAEIFEVRSAALFAGGGGGEGGELPAPDRDRLLKALLRLLILGFFALPAPLSASPFDDGNALYDQQKFAEAKKLYLAQAAAGPVTANLLYNLGNTEFRLGEPGRAALDYERALVLDPAHAEARANLALLRTRTSAQLLPASTLDALIPSWPANTFVVLGAVSAWLAVFALAALTARRRREQLLPWLLLLAGGGVAAWSGLVLWRQAEKASFAITLPAQTEARTEPFDRSALVLALTAASEVRVLEERGAWTWCELPGARRGWLPTASFERLRGS